jgi:hypothetical protein
MIDSIKMIRYRQESILIFIMVSWRTMRIVILALLGMAGLLGAAIFMHYDLPLSLSQLRERFQTPSPTLPPLTDTATTPDATDRTPPTPSFPVLTLNDQAMNPFIEMPNDSESAESPEDSTHQEEATAVMRIAD